MVAMGLRISRNSSLSQPKIICCKVRSRMLTGIMIHAERLRVLGQQEDILSAPLAVRFESRHMRLDLVIVEEPAFLGVDGDDFAGPSRPFWTTFVSSR